MGAGNTNLEPVEGAVVLQGQDVVGDGEEVAVSSHQRSQVKSLDYSKERANTREKEIEIEIEIIIINNYRMFTTFVHGWMELFTVFASN